MHRRDFLAASTGASFSLPVIKSGDNRPSELHWVEMGEKDPGKEVCLCTPGGRILVSVVQDMDDKTDTPLNTWQVLDQLQMEQSGNWVKLGRHTSKARAMQVAEEMFK